MMLSVIIQNNATTEIFRRYSPLFHSALESNELCVCKWLECGTTVETAVPRLYDAIESCEKWRAVIVHLENDDEMSRFPSKVYNPFDFSAGFKTPRESYDTADIPLVRLTQMLGGVPHPEVQFERKDIKEKGHPHRLSYEAHTEESDKKRYKELSEQFSLEAQPPEEIVLVSVRRHYDPETFKHGLLINQGGLSSDDNFVYENGYPERCRFVSFDMNKKGRVGSVDDMFRFWSAVQVIATNELRSGILQAYYLYTAKLSIDKSKLEEVLQRSAGDILFCRNEIDRLYELQKARSDAAARSTAVPDYRLDVEVPLSDTGNVNSVRLNMFSASTGDRRADIENWTNVVTGTEEAFHAIEKNNDRVLDQTAMRIAGSCRFSDNEVYELNAYQLEDFRESLEPDRENVYTLADQLPSDGSPCAKEMERTGKRVKKELLARASGKQVTWGVLAVIVLSLLIVLPSALLNSADDKTARLSAVSALWILIGLVGAVIFASVLIQHGRLKGLLARYNVNLKGRVAEMLDKSDVYSQYLSCIATNIHGNSFLNILGKKTVIRSNEFAMLREHAERLEQFEDTLRLWAKTFRLQVDFEKRNSVTTYFDTEIPPEQNPVYSVSEKDAAELTLLGSGAEFTSHLYFVDAISFKQEELYHDAGEL